LILAEVRPGIGYLRTLALNDDNAFTGGVPRELG